MGIIGRLFRRADKDPAVEWQTSPHPDPTDMSWEEPDDPDFRLAGMRVGLLYKDFNGARTKRVVRLKRLTALEYGSQIHGFCELRQADRTFNIDSIKTLFDPATGEILADAAAFFGPYIESALEEERRAFEKRRFRAVWELIEALRDEVRVMILVARADGRFVRAEQKLLLDYMRERAADLKIAVNDTGLAVLVDWIKLQDAWEPEVRLALKRLASREGAFDAVWEVVDLMAEADRKITPEERATIAEIKTEIQALAG